MGIRPLHDRVLVEPLAEEKIAGGISSPTQRRKSHRKARLLLPATALRAKTEKHKCSTSKRVIKCFTVNGRTKLKLMARTF